ncbi:hypothetical protein QBC47DRAFT_373731 [Echria macrotheca]|uniref:Peptidase S8/S53 domain-containing protein n=1 Tax=Echria macrotheca TaxID=438768 RepID=A0AAJ0F8L7_9PEZI|nr:hypothetical protein QBC47DRAFT_373731 [Echria macrotheca]
MSDAGDFASDPWRVGRAPTWSDDPFMNFHVIPQNDAVNDVEDWGNDVDAEDAQPEQREPVQPVHAPMSENPADEIRRRRNELVRFVCKDSTTQWDAEDTWGVGEQHEAYRDLARALLELEKKSLAETQAERAPINFLQFVLETANQIYPPEYKLQKAKFLLQLITKIDPSQLDPKWGCKPLLAAASFDIDRPKDAFDPLDGDTPPTATPSLAVYLCNLMPDKLAAVELCKLNDRSENLLHLAIQHNLAGVEDLIKKADPRAFEQQRHDGNTPLHVALDFQKFLLPAPICQGRPRLPPTGGLSNLSTSNLTVGQRPEFASQRSAPTVATAASIALNGPPQRQSLPQSPASNQGKPRATAAFSPLGSGQAAKRFDSMQTMCAECSNARIAMSAARERLFSIFRLLVQRNMAVLAVHNSAGLSPYLHLLAARFEYYKDRNAKGDRQAGTPSVQPNSTPLSGPAQESKLPASPVVPTAGAGAVLAERTESKQPLQLPHDTRLSQVKASGAGKGEAQLEADRLRRKMQEEEELKEKLRRQGTRSDGSSDARREGASQPPGNRKDGVRAPASSAARGPIKNNTNRDHRATELTAVDTTPSTLLTQLKELSFWLGHDKASLCLFHNRTAEGAPRFKSDVKRRRRFSLVGNQRATPSTTDNFAFLMFEPTMESVNLSLEYTPEELQEMSLSDDDTMERWAEDEESLKAVFQWLKGEKEVKSILSLTVTENPHHYCSDLTVEECLRGLEVRYLNWNRPDLCANKFTLPNDLIEISLHWSGLNSVLWHWADTQGLRTLNKLQKIHLHVQRGTEPAEQQDAKLAEFEKMVKQWPDRAPEPWCSTLQLEPPFAKRPTITIQDAKRLRGGSKGGGTNTSDPPKHPWFDVVLKFQGPFYNKYKKKVSADPERRGIIKVALLDDGVDPTYHSNGMYLHHAGWPEEDSGELDQGQRSPYVSTNQHGSKMAWLIRNVCPFVAIHVAKLSVTSWEGVRHRTFSLDHAKKAVEWATDQKVDIISMSWNLRQVTGDTGNEIAMQALEDALTNAANANILLFGAACDAKHSALSDRWMPCGHPQVFSIGATDKDFDVKKYVDLGKKVDFLFPGEYILDGSEDPEVGNSGATALAAGLAALVMSCMALEGRSIPTKGRANWMRKIMTKTFDSGSNNKKVRVDDVLRWDPAKELWPLVQKFASEVEL